ncbi:MAG: hypothetical protein B7Y95_14720 [Rhizobiales bacterium 32-66-11]|nr:MAG: hypothetical protein B7Y95_14720 [Rhizobiales bacterium 32-66-11]
MKLTLEDLLTSARQAAAEGRLGLQRGATSAAFVHEDGSPCAIAAAFPSETLKQIVDAGDERLNWLELMRAGYFELGSGLVMAEALTSLQLGYDRCFDEDPEVRARLTSRYIAYLASLYPSHPPEVWPSEVAEHPIWDD